MKRKYPSPRKQAVGLCILAALAPSAHAQIQTAGDLLIDLNFTTLTPGDLTFVANPGTAGGGFEAIGAAGTIPKVQTVPNSTVKALSFDGSDFMVSVTEQTPLGGTPSRLDAPAQLAGFQPVRSVEAWVYNNAPLDEETVLAWGKRGGGDGTNFSCLYGSNTTWGALGQWGAPDLPWGTLPPSGTWHHVTWVHTGPGDGGAIPPTGLFKEERDDQNGHDVDHFDHRIDGGTGGVLVGIAHGVAGNGGLVGIRTLAMHDAVLVAEAVLK